MAVIPRYFSESNATPAINTVKMDPGVAAAPYRAAEQATANFMNVFQNEMGQWGKVVAAKEAEQKRQQEKQMKIQEGLYKAQALANIRTQANEIYQQGLAQSNGSPEFANQFDAQFQKMADPIIEQAPTPEAQIALTKQLIGMRAQYNVRAMNDSRRVLNQVNMNNVESGLGMLEAIIARDPSRLDEIRGHADEIFNSASSLGVPAKDVGRMRQVFERNVQYHIARGEIEQNPLAGLEKYQRGEFSHLGAATNERLENYAKSTKEAYIKKYEEGLNDVQARLVAGLPIPDAVEELFREAPKYGLDSKVNTISRLMQLSNDVGQASPDDLLQAAQTIKMEAASGQLQSDPKEVKLLTDFLEGNAEALRKDPISYAQMKGNINTLPPISDFTKVSDQDIETRKFRALQVQSAYSVKAPAITSAEAQSAANVLQNADPETQAKVIANVNKMGRESANLVINNLPQDSPMAVAVGIGADNPKLAKDIIQGMGIIKSGFKFPNDVNPMAGDYYPELRAIYEDAPEKRKAFIAAGRAIAALENKPTSEGLKEGIKKAGNFVDMDPGIFGGDSGKWTVAPGPNMDSTSYKNFLDKNLKDPSNWQKYATGTPASANNQEPIKFNRMAPSDFQYRYESDGMYRMYYEDKPVLNGIGQPVRIDLKQLYRDINKQ